MKIKIESVNSNNSEPIITYTCSAGKGAGTWSNSGEPYSGKEYSIEIDIDKSLDELNCTKLSNSEMKINLLEDGVRLSGELEDIESDGMCYLRLSPDCLIMIESGDIQVKKGQYLALELSVGDIEIST